MVTTVQVCIDKCVLKIIIIILFTITDINECALYNGGCSQTCSNTSGSYSCSCNSGYVLNIDGHNCTGQ